MALLPPPTHLVKRQKERDRESLPTHSPENDKFGEGVWSPRPIVTASPGREQATHRLTAFLNAATAPPTSNCFALFIYAAWLADW